MHPMNEQEALEQAEFGQAFTDANGDSQPAQDNPALGVEPPDDAQEAAEGGADAGVSVTQEVAPTAADEAVDEPAAPAAKEVDDKEEQRMKSWEGRLRKMEADLMAQKKNNPDASTEKLEKVGEQAEASGNEELSAAAQEAATQVEDGTMSAAQAMKQLTEDFGEEFVRLIETVVSAKASEVGKRAASESVNQVDSKVADIISHIKDSTERSHFEEIAEAHEDFDDIRQTQAFADFVTAGGAARQAVADGGTAKKVIKLLSAYKAASAPAPTKPPPAPPKGASDAAVDAAAGVRSGSVSLPVEPASSDDYSAAWNEAAAQG